MGSHLGLEIGPTNVLHVVAGLAAHYGGPSYSVPRLCFAQSSLGAQVTLASVAGRGEEESHLERNGYRDIRARWDAAHIPLLSRLRLSQGLWTALKESAGAAHVVHNHGLWLIPNVNAALAARKAGVPLVLSPRGMLNRNAMTFSSLQKFGFWHLFQRPSLQDLACIHATSEREAEEALSFGLKAPVAVVPNGIDVPEFDTLSPPPPASAPAVLYFGRLHPIKSIDLLIEAWASVPRTVRSMWQLRIVGPSEGGYDRTLREMVGRYQLSNVTIEDAIYGERKFRAYRAADVVILPSRSENFGLTVAEALACEKPAICTQGAPWSGLLRERCGWWPEHGVRPIAEALQQAMTTPREEREAMGRRGREWVIREFSWESCAARMLRLYGWLRVGGDRPEFVHPC